MKTIKESEIITKDTYNENGRTISELTQEWVNENYNKICCISMERRIKSKQVNS